MKIKIPELRGRYPVRFDRNRFYIPKNIYSALEGSEVKGFQINLCTDGKYKYLEFFPDSEPGQYAIKGRKVTIPWNVKEALGIEKKGHLIASAYHFELWGPSWEEHLNKELEKIDFPDN